MFSRRGAEAAEEPANNESDEFTTAPEPPGTERRQLFRDKGVQFVIYPKNLDSASAAERQALAARLKELIQSIESPEANAGWPALAQPGALP